MANVNRPYGLAPVRTLSGSPYSGRGTRYYIVSTDNNAYYLGDAVISTGGDANGVPGCVKATAGTETPRGIIVGVETAAPNAISLVGTALALENTSIPATKARHYYVYVNDAPDVVFQVQGDATGTNQVAAKASYNCSLTIAAPSNTSFGNSATVVASSTINTTNTLNVKLMGLVQSPGNAYGAYAQWLAMFNLHELSGAGTTAA